MCLGGVYRGSQSDCIKVRAETIRATPLLIHPFCETIALREQAQRLSPEAVSLDEIPPFAAADV
jgi:hypothetical protein